MRVVIERGCGGESGGGGEIQGGGAGRVAYSRVGGPQGALIWRGEGGGQGGKGAEGGISISGHPRRSTRLSPHSSHTRGPWTALAAPAKATSAWSRYAPDPATRPPGTRGPRAPWPREAPQGATAER